MKKVLFLSAFILIFIACRKNKNSAGQENSSCYGSFISFEGYSFISSGGVLNSGIGLYWVHDSISWPVSPPPVAGSGIEGNGVYDPDLNHFYAYAYGIPPSDYTLYLMEISDPGLTNPIHIAASTLGDTAGIKYLLCNGTTHQLYLVRAGTEGRQYICAINTTGTFSESPIFALDSPGTIATPVIDEKTGFIYFYSTPNLEKVDPASGASSVVATYTNVIPDQLQYDNNDGMFYGVSYGATPYTFIRISPGNGVVTTLASLPFFTKGMGHTFDFCSGLYIVEASPFNGAYWLDPSNGKIVKQWGTNTSNTWGTTYVNDTML